MASRPFAIIAGVGPGTGAALARRFAQSYPVALLARNPSNYDSLVTEINNSGGRAIGIATDVSSGEDVRRAISQIETELGGGGSGGNGQGAEGKKVGCAAAVFNASGQFFRKGLLDLTEEEFTAGYEVSCKGAFLFSQAVLPLLLRRAEETSNASTTTTTTSNNNKSDSTPSYPPTLIYTGATASVKASALMSSFATGKWAMRALAQSVAREFAPKGIHVAHAIIDGVIDIPRTKEWLKDQPAEAKISAEGIAEAYWNLHAQPVTAFTNEIDVRPMLEKW